jgi:hypothetical protein
MDSFRLPLSFSLAALALTLCACAGSSGNDSPNTNDAGDGKYHPAGNGKPVAATDACNELSQSVSAQGSKACSGQVFTVGQCPGGDAAKAHCAQFDQGTVQGCVTYFNSAMTCDDLRAKATNCVVACQP